MKDRFDNAVTIFRNNDGIMRTGDAINAGIHPSTLYSLYEKGILEQVSRGLYRLVDTQIPENPDILFVSWKMAEGVICLISALAYYELTLQIPHEVYVAIPRGARKPKFDYPPIRVFRFIGSSYNEGIETVYVNKLPVKIYCMEKTIADAFKFRNRIGLDTATEALRSYMERKDRNIDKLMHYAEICRVSRIIRPYIEALI